MPTAFLKLAVVVLIVSVCCGVEFETREAGDREKRQSKKAVISFESATYKVSEQDGVATIGIKREGNIYTTVSVRLMTRAITAVGGRDYTAIRQTLWFKAGEVLKKVGVKIIDDDVFETDKLFRVILSLRTQSTCNRRVCLGPKSATDVTIVNDDELNPCNPTHCGMDALCTTRNDRPVCSCPQGYQGNPFVKCSKFDACSPTHCGTDALCTTRNDIPVCSCPPGYQGEPFVKCSKSDACTPTPCGINALCQTRDGGAVCSCPLGYTGNPLVQCSLAE